MVSEISQHTNHGHNQHLDMKLKLFVNVSPVVMIVSLTGIRVCHDII